MMQMTTSISTAVAAIERALTAWGLPGTIVGMTDHQQLRGIVVHGYADLKARTRLTEQARFGIGSISKSFTAMAVLQLADEGRVDLHAPITRYLPDLTLSSPFEPISAHHLLSHTSGLPFGLTHTYSSRYAIAALRDIVPGYPPGSHGSYSNTGYQLLGYLIEDLEGVSYASAIQRRILEPLGMASTVAIIDRAERAAMVPSYVRWPDGAYFEAPWYEYAAADGSLISTVSDMCVYARCILNRGVGPSGRLLSEAAFKAWTTPVVPEGLAYGLFVRKEEGGTRVAHGGAIHGFHSELDVHLDAGFGLVMLSSTPVPGELMHWITNTVTAAFRGESATSAPMRQDAAQMEEYAGVYHLVPGPHEAESHTLECVVQDRCLWLKQERQLKRLERMGGDCFRVAGRDSDGLPFFFGRADADAGLGVVEQSDQATQSDPRQADKIVTDVSHGARWYIREGISSQAVSVSSQQYSAYVGHFENFCPEGPVARVFVRNGRLRVMFALGEGAKAHPLEPIGPGTFRLGDAHSPERVQFDTLMNGRAERMTWSGVPLYRNDTV